MKVIETSNKRMQTFFFYRLIHRAHIAPVACGCALHRLLVRPLVHRWKAKLVKKPKSMKKKSNINKQMDTVFRKSMQGRHKENVGQEFLVRVMGARAWEGAVSGASDACPPEEKLCRRYMYWHSRSFPRNRDLKSRDKPDFDTKRSD